MHDHWIPRWVEGLSWWIKWAFMGGAGALSAFLPSILAPHLQVLGASVGGALVAVACLGAIWHAINQQRQKHGKTRLKLEPNYLIIFGLTVALIGVAWQQLRGPQPLHWDQGQTIPLEASPSPPQAKLSKHYFAAEKIELGNLLSEIADRLNKEGLSAANQAYTFGNDQQLSKVQLAELLQRIDAVRNLTIKMSRGIWDAIIYKNQRFDSELRDVVGNNSGNSPLTKFQMSLNEFYRELTILNQRYDNISNEDRNWITSDFIRRYGADAHYASSEFKAWIQQCNSRIDEKRELLR